MPFTGVASPDPEKLKLAAQRLCEVFGVDELYPHQVEAGQNILKGISTILDVPTGGGKTLAFWYPLFYHWWPGNIDKDCQKIVLVVGPLVALLEEQAKTLNEKGIPAVAITGNSPNLDQELTKLGKNKYRVGLVGPEMVLSTQFHEKLHCILEWGDEDFRPEYRQLVHLAARLPAKLPILGASATIPYHVVKDVLANLSLPGDCARVEVSNDKLNVFLAVRIMQHEPDSYADLVVLFPDDMEGPQDFPQSLLYGNERQEVEKIQDFLRDNRPPCLEENGALRGVSATDALGIGMDFRTIMRLYLWKRPRSFLSTVQKIGRCVRDPTKRGEAVLYITKAMYTRCCAELEILKAEKEAAAKDDEVSEDDENADQPLDREAALELQDSSDEEEEPVIAKRRKTKVKQKVLSSMEERDQRYLLEFSTTTECRRRVWNRYFGNRNKQRLNLPFPPGPCCENCNPEAFPVPTISMLGERKLRIERKGLSSPELEEAARKRLNNLREEIIAAAFPDQHFLTGNAILSDDILDVLAKRARLLTSLDTLRQHTHWVHASKYGNQVVTALQEVLVDFPDHAAAEREAQAAAKAQRTLQAAEFKELRSRLLLVFEGCYDAVVSELEYPDDTIAPGRKRKKNREPRRRCQIFLKLPRRNVWPGYYDIIKEPISMSNIKTLSEKPTHYTSIKQYQKDWHLMFDNARQFNVEGSQVYEDAVYLQRVLDSKLYALSAEHRLPGYDELLAFVRAFSVIDDLGPEILVLLEEIDGFETQKLASEIYQPIHEI
ncbi:p-loop containing nucleoside triphosphate hydrolase protein [Favolaschia claudopus]|uniref:DNA 3'-5' helicase n=1 Tax=Favolaschia claudopus TaxID=2862362 RepID=A0AAV9Z7F1_9AGAR